MPRGTLTINGQPIPFYDMHHRRDVFGRLPREERCLDDYDRRRVVPIMTVFHYFEYLLADRLLVVSWDKVKPETVAEIAGPEPGASWVKGTITTTAGTTYELEYVLSPHTKEQSEKVFRERMLDQTAKQNAVTDAVLVSLAAKTDMKRAKPATKSANKAEPVTASDALEAEIIRILNRDFTRLTARPTASEFYQEYVINTRTMAGLACAKTGWKTRTLKQRKADIEAHLSEVLHVPVDLDTLRNAPRKSGKIIYKDPGIIERTHCAPQDEED